MVIKFLGFKGGHLLTSGLSGWALIRGGHLFKGGRLIEYIRYVLKKNFARINLFQISCLNRIILLWICGILCL